ncbi:hypothetical protein Gohar_021953 [Gossypium harknessii]|uniref:DUF4283 domain-containing protein n=1 Tax=Gossypium harknessii TaxID=34285 RepID=A0A7J9IEI4_9ROSI|nr:hypothetical protein [Gossypium harknessii]
MEIDITNLNLEDEEEEPIPCEKYSSKEDDEHRLCLVGKTLIDCVVHFPSLKRTLVDLWHPLGGVIILDLGGEMVVISIFYKEDIKRVMDGMSWSFNMNLIVFHWLVNREYPKQIPLNYIYFWIQVHNLPFVEISEGLARQLGDFIRQFIQDAVLISRGERRYMRFRVKIDVRLTLKRKKKLALGQGRKTIMIQEVKFGWDSSLRTPSRNEMFAESKWLKEDVPSGF